MKPLYTISPAAWDRSKRIDQSQADHANPFIGHRGPRAIGPFISVGIAILLCVVLVSHFVARAF